ncbi:hypothetical protein V7087_15940 [Neobacillus niacini]|uniref:hypothetical protein n=1 Tax=Neobacillus niacini TaxID=86668 RepID=UPI002FFF84F0
MAIRDRGKLKWRPASFMPEGFAMTRAMFNYIDPIQHHLRVEIKPGEFQRVDLDSVIRVVVVE